MITCICDICKKTVTLDELRPGGCARSPGGIDRLDCCDNCFDAYDQACSDFWKQNQRESHEKCRVFLEQWIAERTKV